MDLKQLVILLVRLVGLWLVVSTIIELTRAVPLLWQSAAAGSMLIWIISPMLIGAILWFMPAPITNILIKDPPIIDRHNDFFPNLERAAIALLGLYICYVGVLGVFEHYVYGHFFEEILGQELNRVAQRRVSLLMSWIQIAIGVLFVFGAKALTISIRKMWALGKKWPTP